MKIFYAPYELKGKFPFASRNGALLKVIFENGMTGYADCHPWTELGDKPLSEQLSLLLQGDCTSLTKQSLQFAKIDGEARINGKNIFTNLTVPPSHWFLKSFEEPIPNGFSLCKIKVGKNLDEEFKQLPNFFKNIPENVSVRLDFNNRTDYRTFLRYIEVLSTFAQQIDYIEDPFAYDPGEWEGIQKKYAIQLGCDFRSECYYRNVSSHSITVIKPAVQDDLSIINDSQFVVYTSYLDHPIGQLAAAYSAAIAAKEYPKKILTCGLITHHVYQDNPYSEDLSIDGNRLIPPVIGTGFGFNEQLKRENWIQLK